MPRFRIKCEYGALTAAKIVEARDAEHAWEMTGVLPDLEAAGWVVVVDEPVYEVEQVADDTPLSKVRTPPQCGVCGEHHDGDCESRECTVCGEPCILADPADPESWVHGPFAHDGGDHTAEVE